MRTTSRFILIAVAAVVVLVAVAALAVPLFLNADTVRTRIEASLTKSLGRRVAIGKLSFALFTGGLNAENATVADDPAFSSVPFIQADIVKIRVEVLPLLIHREVHVQGFSLQSTKIQLLRAANGVWNYSTIGSSGAAASQDEETKKTFPDLTVGRLDVIDGRITVGTQPSTASTTPNRVYEQVSLHVTKFGFTKPFDFTASATLPAGGTVNINGTAGPVNQQDASATPFSGHLELKHIDPLAAGFVDTSAGISGLVETLVLDAAWSGQQMHVTKLLVDSPHLSVVRGNAPKAPRPAGNAEGAAMLDSLSVDDAEIRNGAVTLTTAGVVGAPVVYQQLNAHITNLTPRSWSPFTVSAQLPGGGSLNAGGKAGPFNMTDNAATPVDAKVALNHVELETSGVLSPDAGISGLADLQAQVQSNGQALNATGTAHVANIKLARNGRPSAKPVDAQFSVTQNELAMTGEIQHATISVGRAAVNIAGTYQASGPTTAINLKVDGRAMPIDELEAFLPALGVQLPQGSRLQGGTLTADLAVSGSTAAPVITGPVRLDNTRLAGFDLGSKLKTLSQLTGGRIGSATGSGTDIRFLSMDLHEAGGNLRTDRLNVDVAGVGTAAGAGSISAGGALDYNVVLKLTGLAPASATPSRGSSGAAGGLAGLAGLIPGGGGGLGSVAGLGGGVLRGGIPVAIGGTTSNPTFAPNLSGLTTGIGVNAAKGLISGRSSGKDNSGKVVGDTLGSLFGKHQ